eukprot:7502501-Alexandrium_andersonii.AAC.1
MAGEVQAPCRTPRFILTLEERVAYPGSVNLKKPCRISRSSAATTRPGHPLDRRASAMAR